MSAETAAFLSVFVRNPLVVGLLLAALTSAVVLALAYLRTMPAAPRYRRSQ